MDSLVSNVAEKLEAWTVCWLCDCDHCVSVAVLIEEGPIVNDSSTRLRTGL